MTRFLDTYLQIKWWERIVLLFCPLKSACDNDSDGTTICQIFYKTWRGKIYVLREENIGEIHDPI